MMAFFWKTGLKTDPDPLLHHYYVEVLRQKEFFQNMHWYDLANVITLKESGLMPEEVAATLLEGLKEMEMEGVVEARSKLPAGIHSGELYLQNKFGEAVSGWIHIGRASPTNRTVASRMFVRELILEQMDGVLQVQEALLERASQHAHDVMPGYSYSHRLEPCTFGYYLLTFVYSLQRVFDSFLEAYRHTNECSAGAEAGYGSYFGVDLDLATELMGFDKIADHSRETLRQFDYMLLTMFSIALGGNVAARLARDLRIYSTQEFGLLQIAPQYCIVSSVAAQMRIPYSPEIIASIGGLLAGKLAGAFSISKTTSDEPFVGTELELELRSAAEEAKNMWHILAGTITTLVPNTQRMKQLAYEGLTQSTRLIALLMKQGKVSYRQAHHVVTEVTNQVMTTGEGVAGITTELLREEFQKHIGVDIGLSDALVKDALDVESCVRAKVTPGSTSPAEVQRLLAKCGEQSALNKNAIRERRDKLEQARCILEERIAAARRSGK